MWEVIFLQSMDCSLPWQGNWVGEGRYKRQNTVRSRRKNGLVFSPSWLWNFVYCLRSSCSGQKTTIHFNSCLQVLDCSLVISVLILVLRTRNSEAKMATKQSWTLTEKVKLITHFEKSGRLRMYFPKCNLSPRMKLNTILSTKKL